MRTESVQDERLITESEAASYLRLRPRTLQNWRWTGEGPPFVRISARAVRYRKTDLDRWIAERSVPTAEVSTANAALSGVPKGGA